LIAAAATAAFFASFIMFSGSARSKQRKKPYVAFHEVYRAAQMLHPDSPANSSPVMQTQSPQPLKSIGRDFCAPEFLRLEPRVGIQVEGIAQSVNRRCSSCFPSNIRPPYFKRTVSGCSFSYEREVQNGRRTSHTATRKSKQQA
jgi:hypothetical protein